MSAVKAIFNRQLNDFPKNMSVSIMFFLWPIMAFVMNYFMGEYGAMQVGMFAGFFVGSAPMIAIANTVAEDNEYKSLRFLVMAGVKPVHYLAGLTISVFLMSALTIAAFVLIGDFQGQHLAQFLIASAIGAFASALLGAVFGIFAKNVQQASTIYTPAMMILMFLPMLSMFNETIALIAQFTFSYQVLAVVQDPNVDFTRALIVMAANIAVLLVLFAVAYKKKGLKG